jgi:hypothetical protein
LTFPGFEAELPSVSRQAHERENHDASTRDAMPYEMGVQVPRSIYTKVPTESALRTTAAVSRRGI